MMPLSSQPSRSARAGSGCHCSPQADAPTRTVFATVADRNGAPVPDLSPASFTVKVGGKERQVVQVQPAAAPLRIAVIVDDNGTGLFRYGLGKFMEKLQGRAEFSISKVEGQTRKIVGYTADGRELGMALGQLGARPETADGGQLLEGIADAARDFAKHPVPRAHIIALTVGGEEHSTLPAHHVLDELRKSGAALHVILVSRSALRSTVAVQRPSALLGENLNLSEVLGEGPKQSGGSRGEIVATAGLVSGLQQLAQALLHNQYAVSYSQGAGEKRSDRISVSSRVPGVTVLAPTRIPTK